MDIHLTEDEIVELLKRSSITSVIVEGKDDMTIYRWIEEKIGISRANFFPCGGRETLLKVYKRRSEFSHIRTLFLADKDSYLYLSIPPEYAGVIWTNGYSIENDLYFGKFLERMLTDNEQPKFRMALTNFILYYSFEVERCERAMSFNLAHHPNIILDEDQNLNQTFLKDRGFVNPSPETVEYLADNYDLLIRGKSLFALLLRFLSHNKRTIKHSRKGLLETAFRLNENKLILELVSTIVSRLEEAS